MFGDIYRGKRVLITGHTGFKGSWLALWLTRLGANVTGIARNPPTDPSHFDILKLGEKVNSINLDLRHYPFRHCDGKPPDIVFHLAAMAIVAKTFDLPRYTFETNVMGGVNVLESCRLMKPSPPVVMITTDKVYENKEWAWGYRENDQLGGYDPYAASKVCVEHVIDCYRKSFGMQIATARAGNVIGGADWAYKRLIPDIVRATIEDRPVEIHTPGATRPWQYVLEPLSGYLLLGQHLLERPCQVPERLNFGPEGEMTVLNILEIAQMVWPRVQYVVKPEETHPMMTELLKIDSTEAKNRLGWRPVWNMREAVERSIMWYREYYEHGFVMSNHDIDDYERGLR